ncbi:hypothetical protein ACFWYW_46460 [Nonomuraea sp. NPDC059023]|uniref:hypothetical protein n=1 Tax=unclassified Nonomuraea TaxID=2593643 RepID=UPI00369F4B4F
MAVVAADMLLGVRRPVVGRDAHGSRVVTSLGPVEGPEPGRVVSEPRADNRSETGPGVWVLALDPGFWPVAEGVQVVEVGGAGRTWTISAAEFRPSAFDAGISYIRAEAALNVS